MNWQHQYECKNCPRCGADLALVNAVAIEGRGTDGSYLGSFTTSLDDDGRLYPDAAGILKSGFHAGSSCRECGQSLEVYEQVANDPCNSSSEDLETCHARDPASLPAAELVKLGCELQRLMYAETHDDQTIWNLAKQAAVSPADLQQNLELLMRKFGLLPGSTPSFAEVQTTLSRSGCADLATIIASRHGTLDISFPGYSDKTSDCGPVIYLELNEQGHPQLYAWTDITNEEPTHVLSFAEAMDERMVE